MREKRLTANYVPALQGEIVQEDDHQAITTAEVALMAGGHQLAGAAMAGRTGHSRAEQSDTAVSHSIAHLIASAPVVGSLLATTTGLMLLGWLLAGGPAVLWISIELVIVGAGAIVALNRSRRIGLEHSPGGVERYEIDARVEVAKFAIDRHLEAMERLKGVRK